LAAAIITGVERIRLADGTTIRVGSDVTAATLRRVLTALRG
jgi:hypothetical protein